MQMTREQQWWTDQMVQVMLGGKRALDAVILRVLSAAVQKRKKLLAGSGKARRAVPAQPRSLGSGGSRALERGDTEWTGLLAGRSALGLDGLA